MRLRCRLILAASAVTTLLLGGPVATPAFAYASLPAHVYAPYYETYLAPGTPSITAEAQASGARYFSLAFLLATKKGSCSIDWNSNASR